MISFEWIKNIELRNIENVKTDADLSQISVKTKSFHRFLSFAPMVMS